MRKILFYNDSDVGYMDEEFLELEIQIESTDEKIESKKTEPVNEECKEI